MIRIVFQSKITISLELISEFRFVPNHTMAKHVLRQEKSNIWMSTEELIDQLHVFNKEIINIMITSSVSRSHIFSSGFHTFPLSLLPFIVFISLFSSWFFLHATMSMIFENNYIAKRAYLMYSFHFEWSIKQWSKKFCAIDH